ncbi:MAG: GNAT family N-acetyltransferase [Candidatus Neomarinimicrobiota bacterium]
MLIDGDKIRLRPALAKDRKKVFRWLTASDITNHLMGPPDYPDLPIPTWEEFIADYTLNFFSPAGDGRGRNFIIINGGEEIGMVGYDSLDPVAKNVVLDIWLKAEKYCGRGSASAALKTLCIHLHKVYGITRFIISPSARNRRAVAAYRKAGFEYIRILSRSEQVREFGSSEYDDNVLMIKSIDD